MTVPAGADTGCDEAGSEASGTGVPSGPVGAAGPDAGTTEGPEADATGAPTAPSTMVTATENTMHTHPRVMRIVSSCFVVALGYAGKTGKSIA
jgi:hypothetical protein